MDNIKNMLKKIDWKTVGSMLLVSILPLIISYCSYNIATDSKKISEEALSRGARPYLSVKPIRSDKNDSYIFANEIPNGLSMELIFEITNTGTSVARNIKTSDIFATTIETFENANPKIELLRESKANTNLSGTVALVPSEAIFMSIKINIPIINKNAQTDILEKIKNNTYSFPFAFEINYEGGEKMLNSYTFGLSVDMLPQEIKYNYSVNK